MTLTQPEATTSVPYTSTATTERTVSIIGTAETPAPGLANDKNAKISENNLAQNHQYIYNMQMLIFIPYIKLAWWHIGPRWVAWGHLLSVFKGHVRPFFLLVMKFLLNTLAVLRLESFGVYQVIGPNPILDFITKSVKVRITKWFRNLFRCSVTNRVFENPKIKANAQLDSRAVCLPIFSPVIQFIHAPIAFQVD